MAVEYAEQQLLRQEQLIVMCAKASRAGLPVLELAPAVLQAAICTAQDPSLTTAGAVPDEDEDEEGEDEDEDEDDDGTRRRRVRHARRAGALLHGRCNTVFPAHACIVLSVVGARRAMLKAT